MNIVPEDSAHNFHVNFTNSPGDITPNIKYIVLAANQLIICTNSVRKTSPNVYVSNINEFFDAVDILKKEAVKQRLLK